MSIRVCLVDLYTEATSLPGQAGKLVATFERQGVELVGRYEPGCAAIICGSIARMLLTRDALRESLYKAPLFVYCWDLYSWVWSNSRKAHNYRQFGELMKHAREVWVPSECTADAVRQYYPAAVAETVVVKSLVNCFDEGEIPADDGTGTRAAGLGELFRPKCYALNVLRRVPADSCCYWAETACQELGIPCVTPNHRLSEHDWRLTLTGARFTISAYREASTGGLSIMEGYYHGVPALLSDSTLHAGMEYMGARAAYFAGNSFAALRERIAELWASPPKIDVAAAREWVEQEYSYDAFAARVIQRLAASGVV